MGEAGGYGMLIGPQSTAAQREEFRADPGRSAELHRAADDLVLARALPIDDELEPRHVDLRPYILYGDKVNIVPGGLTRVALKRGSLVVNSRRAAAARIRGC